MSKQHRHGFFVFLPIGVLLSSVALLLTLGAAVLGSQRSGAAPGEGGVRTAGSGSAGSGFTPLELAPDSMPFLLVLLLFGLFVGHLLWPILYLALRDADLRRAALVVAPSLIVTALLLGWFVGPLAGPLVYIVLLIALGFCSTNRWARGEEDPTPSGRSVAASDRVAASDPGLATRS